MDELYERGVELFEKGDHLEAEGLLREVIKLKPGYADILNKLGVIASLDGRLEEAVSCFRKAIAINPGYTEAALNLTICHNEMGDVEEAARVFEESAKRATARAARLDPFAAGKLANEHLRVGNIYFDFGLIDEAIDEYRKALKLREGLPDVLTRLGMALREKKEFNEAVTELTKAKEANPLYGPALIQLGLTYYMRGLTGLAFEEWEDALGRLPDLKEARGFLNVLRSGE